MRKNVGKDGMPVVEFDLSDIHKVKNGELTWPCGDETECIIPTSESGERTRYTMTPDARWEFCDKERKRQRAEYDALLRQRVDKERDEILRRYDNAPKPERYLQAEIIKRAYITDAAARDTLTNKEHDLHRAYHFIDLQQTYIGGLSTETRKGFRTLGFRPLIISANNRDKYVDVMLRDLFIEAQATAEIVDWLRTLQEQPAPTERDEASTGAEIEDEPLDGTRESVATILDTLRDAFITQKDFDAAVNRLCEYFDGEPKQGVPPLRVKRNNWKALGKALGDIHEDIRTADVIGRDYLQFAKDTFDCFKKQDISGERLQGVTLYKYMKG